MILVTSRPDPEGGSWDFRFHAQRNYPHRLTELTLAPLPPDESERLVENLLRARRPARAIRAPDSRAVGGQSLLRRGDHPHADRAGRAPAREGDRWVSGGRREPPRHAHDPPRLDRGPNRPVTRRRAKATLQRASVIGRFLSYRALRALHEGDERARSIARPSAARRADARVGPRARATSTSSSTRSPRRRPTRRILHEQRRTLHRRLAIFLEHETTAAPDRAPLLAHHWLRAEDWEKALTYSAGSRPAGAGSSTRARSHRPLLAGARRSSIGCPPPRSGHARTHRRLAVARDAPGLAAQRAGARRQASSTSSGPCRRRPTSATSP